LELSKQALVWVRNVWKMFTDQHASQLAIFMAFAPREIENHNASESSDSFTDMLTSFTVMFKKNEHPGNNSTPENKHCSSTVLMNLQVVSPAQQNTTQRTTKNKTRHNTTEKDHLSN
jgi:hypothetical protein